MLGRRGEDATWTIVGDPAQATLATPGEMEAAVGRLLRGRRVHRFNLAINYRTPKEIMEYAAEASGISLDELRSIRSGTPPVFFRYEKDPKPAVEQGVKWLREQGGSGCFVVLDPDELLEGATAEFEVLWALDAKGLEFDHVVLYRPEAVDRTFPADASLVLIGATRATKGLAVITAE
jgi:DNA helicase IV